MTRRNRRPQLLVYLPEHILDEAAAAVVVSRGRNARPRTLSELVEDAIRDALPVLADRVNEGRGFDTAKGAAARAARRHPKSVAGKSVDR